MENIILIQNIKGSARRRITILPRTFDVEVNPYYEIDDNCNKVHSLEIVFCNGIYEVSHSLLSIPKERLAYYLSYTDEVTAYILGKATANIVDFINSYQNKESMGISTENKSFYIDEFQSEMQSVLEEYLMIMGDQNDLPF